MKKLHPFDPKHPDFIETMKYLVAKRFFGYHFAAHNGAQVPRDAELIVDSTGEGLSAFWRYRGVEGETRRLRFNFDPYVTRANSEPAKDLAKVLARSLIRHFPDLQEDCDAFSYHDR